MPRTIEVTVQPRSSSRKVVCLGDSKYKVYTHKPAVDGQANGSVIELICEHLNVKKNAVSIVKGHRAKKKILQINE